MLYIAKTGIVLPQNTPELSVHTNNASSEVRFVTKKDITEFKPGDVLYVLHRNDTVTTHTFFKPFNKEAEDAYNDQCRIRNRERLFQILRTRVDGAFVARISNRLSGRYKPTPWKIVTFGDLMRRSEGDLKSIGLGRESISLIQDVLSIQGLYLGMFRYMKIEELDLSVRATNTLIAHNVTTMADLLEQTRTQVRIATQSVKATKEIEEKLASLGFSLAD